MSFPVPKDQRGSYPFPTPRELRHEWTELLCSGPQNEIDATLLAFHDSLRELESLGDTTRGIHVKFGPDTRYATIIKAFDICRETVIRWELDDHNLWALHYPEPEPKNTKADDDIFFLDCGTNRSCIVRAEPTVSEQIALGLEKIGDTYIKSYWMTWSLVALLGMLAFRSSIRAAKPI